MATKAAGTLQKRMEMCDMSENELELIAIIRESADPQAVAAYAFTLLLDYLRKSAPSQEIPSADPLESI